MSTDTLGAAPLVLIACGSRKLSRAAEAKDLYVGDLFKKSRAWAERFGSTWFILSAKHGLLDPATVIEPYDKTLNHMAAVERDAWDRMVFRQFNEAGLLERLRDCHLTILGGERYRRWSLEIANVTVPMQGLGIGQQKAWLNRQLA